MGLEKINQMLDKDIRVCHPFWMFDYDKSEYKVRVCIWSWHAFRPHNVNIFKINQNSQYCFRQYWRGGNINEKSKCKKNIRY